MIDSRGAMAAEHQRESVLQRQDRAFADQLNEERYGEPFDLHLLEASRELARREAAREVFIVDKVAWDSPYAPVILAVHSLVDWARLAELEERERLREESRARRLEREERLSKGAKQCA